MKENGSFGRLNKAVIAAGFAAVAAVSFPAASFAEVKVILSNGFGAAYREALPEFEKSSGIKVTTATGASQGNGPNTIGAQLRRGESADVVIMNKAGLDDLMAEGKIAAGTHVDLARTLLAVAIRSGTPKPDVSTVDAFKKTLLGARSISVDASTSGIYLTTKAFPRLGIASEMAGKTIKEGARGVASGKADIAVMLVSEILPVKGVEVAAPVPAEIQDASVFSAAVVKGAKQAEAAKHLIDFLASERASSAIRHSGMEPLGRR
ncbi:MAG TPA: substrate-binding domain-containing protein [Micropepsaceae bacterium]|nr:substrate-binding domain-containing protein [Micropepsaceae bacterium]